jgi:riboflavin synthase
MVERVGTLVRSTGVAGGRRLRVDAGSVARDCELGASVCVDGVCLTVAAKDGDALEFDVVIETLQRTTLGSKSPGAALNLERSLRVGDRLDGHFVLGHVDGTASVDRVSADAREHVVWLRPDAHLAPYLIPKGSVAIDGVSLTIAERRADSFSVALIPTTLQRTTLSTLKTGARVNIESDIIARTVADRLASLLPAEGLTRDALTRAGFA